MGTVAVDPSLEHFLSNGLNFLHFLPLFLNSPQVCLWDYQRRETGLKAEQTPATLTPLIALKTWSLEGTAVYTCVCLCMCVWESEWLCVCMWAWALASHGPFSRCSSTKESRTGQGQRYWWSRSPIQSFSPLTPPLLTSSPILTHTRTHTRTSTQVENSFHIRTLLPHFYSLPPHSFHCFIEIGGYGKESCFIWTHTTDTHNRPNNTTYSEELQTAGEARNHSSRPCLVS